MTQNKVPKQQSTYPLSADKENFRALFSSLFRQGKVQLLTEGNPFTLVISDKAVRKIQAHDLGLVELPKPARGADGSKFTHAILWEDTETALPEDKRYGLMTFFDNHMNKVMEAIHGIRVAAPFNTVSDVQTMGRIHDHGHNLSCAIA